MGQRLEQETPILFENVKRDMKLDAVNIGHRDTVQSGSAGCVKGFVTSFLEVPLACLGSMATAVQHSCLWNSQ